MKRFSNQDEFNSFAESFLKEQTENVLLCMEHSFQPLPTLLYCFSTIDLLGALYKGNVGKVGEISKNSREYMKDYMGYAPEQSELLQKLFRHQIVHLAQIPTVINYNSKYYTWRHHYNNRATHLCIETFNTPKTMTIIPGWAVQADCRFNVSIKTLAEDIRESVIKAGGYLESLRNSRARGDDLQDNFEKVIEEVFTPA